MLYSFDVGKSTVELFGTVLNRSKYMCWLFYFNYVQSYMSVCGFMYVCIVLMEARREYWIPWS